MDSRTTSSPRSIQDVHRRLPRTALVGSYEARVSARQTLHYQRQIRARRRDRSAAWECVSALLARGPISINCLGIEVGPETFEPDQLNPRGGKSGGTGRTASALLDPRVFELTEVIAVAGYRALADVYEWLIPDAMLTPAGSVAAFGDLVKSLPPNARVLDCACGTGQLAVGLAGLGLDVIATDASGGMVRRTQELADEVGVSLRTLQVSWDKLPDHLDASSFDVVFCVGNSLHHAEGASGRLAALASMSRLLNRGGRLVLTSRTWELVRASGSRFDIRDRLIRRNGRDAVVIYNWQIEQLWEQEHSLEIAVAQVEPDGSVLTRSERLSCWPFRYEELVAQLQSVGLKVETTTFNPDAEGYTVVAGSD